jgi:hypothetical protein
LHFERLPIHMNASGGTEVAPLSFPNIALYQPIK